MKIDTRPAFARRLRLSTAGITAAVTVTCLALLAIAVTVGPSQVATEASAVTFEAPLVGSVNPAIAPVTFTSGDVQPVSGTASDSISGGILRN